MIIMAYTAPDQVQPGNSGTPIIITDPESPHKFDAADYSYSHKGADTSWRPNLSPGAGPRGATPRTTASTQGDWELDSRSDTRKCDK